MQRRTTLKAAALGLTALGIIPAASAAPSAPAAGKKTAPFDFEKRTVRLNDGHDMPIIGLGVFTLDDATTESASTLALQNGYRLIDTAHVYSNEEAVGRAVKKSGVPRAQVFITTKLWTSDFGRAAPEIDNMLKRLDTDYIDLLLLHHPADRDEDAYSAMEQAVKAGKVRSIGLSNYYEKEFGRIMKGATITPSVVQNETHPYNQWKALKKFFDGYGTVLESWYPLGGRDRFGRSGFAMLAAEPVIVELAKKHGKTTSQIILRWHLQDGNIAIPRSSNPAHIKENISIFDFALDAEDMQRMASLDKQQRFSTF